MERIICKIEEQAMRSDSLNSEQKMKLLGAQSQSKVKTKSNDVATIRMEIKCLMVVFYVQSEMKLEKWLNRATFNSSVCTLIRDRGCHRDSGYSSQQHCSSYFFPSAYCLPFI